MHRGENSGAAGGVFGLEVGVRREATLTLGKPGPLPWACLLDPAGASRTRSRGLSCLILGR